MKRLKITSVLLSAVMCISMMAAPVTVIADEAAAPEETQTAEVTKKEEPKETEKPAPKETEKPAETQKPAPKETEKQEKDPVETEKKDPQVTEKETEATEKPEPSETEKQEPTQTEESSENDKPEPEETEIKEPEVVETPGPGTGVRKKPVDSLVDSGACGDNLTYELDSNGVLKISGTGPMYDYRKPNSESPWHGHAQKISSVIISDGVTSIGVKAFNECSILTNISIPDSVKTIGGKAFYKCYQLTSISIPQGVSKIPQDCFYKCSVLNHIDIPNSVTTIESGAFDRCLALHEITIPTSVKKIEKWVFTYSGLGRVYYSGSESDWNNIDIDWSCYVSWGIDGSTGNERDNSLLAFANVYLPDGKVIRGKKRYTLSLNILTYDSDGTTLLEPTNIGGTASLNKTTAIPGDVVKILDVYPQNGFELKGIDCSGVLWDDRSGVKQFVVQGVEPVVNVYFVRKPIITFEVATGAWYYDTNNQIHDDFHEKCGVIGLSKTSVHPGDEVTVNVTPKSGYKVRKIELYTDHSYDITAEKRFTVGNVQPNVWVYFEQDSNTYSISCNTSSNGTVKLSHDNALVNDVITVTATPDSGYAVEKITWKLEGSSAENDITDDKCFLMPDGNVYVTVTFKAKDNNTLTVSPKTAKVKYKKLKKKAQTVARANVMNVSNAQGKVSYKLTGVKRGKSKKYKKYFKINASTGNVTIKKKLKKGTYKVTCRVTAAGDANYKAGAKTVTFKIKVK